MEGATSVASEGSRVDGPVSMLKVAFADFIEMVMESIDFYDFYIYGTAALVLGGVFFPEFSAALCFVCVLFLPEERELLEESKENA